MDAFLVHTWAVTVTGAPKLWAMRFVEAQEESPRCWYVEIISPRLYLRGAGGVSPLSARRRAPL